MGGFIAAHSIHGSKASYPDNLLASQSAIRRAVFCVKRMAEIGRHHAFLRDTRKRPFQEASSQIADTGAIRTIASKTIALRLNANSSQLLSQQQWRWHDDCCDTVSIWEGFMNIQLTTYSAALNLCVPQPQRQRVPEAAATSADSVTISQAARDRLSAESGARSDATLPNSFSQAAHADPKLAEKLAYDYSHDPLVPWLDFSDHTNGTGPIRYAATGQPVTEESEGYFNRFSSAELQNRVDLYNSEKAKGTPAADILDKIFGYIDTLPTRYKEMINWSGSSAG